MSKTIYVVQGSTGEYSDRTDWIVCAFEDKEQAATYEQDLTDLSVKYANRSKSLTPVKSYLLTYSDPSDFESKVMFQQLKELDPKFEMDYTGTYYTVTEVELR